MSKRTPFSIVETHTSPWEAHISRALLESEGIPVFLANEHHIWANWPYSLALGGVRVLVPVGYVDAAVNVFKIRDSGKLQTALLAQCPFGQPTCLQCGSTKLIQRLSLLSIAVAICLWGIGLPYPPAKGAKCTACGSWRIGET